MNALTMSDFANRRLRLSRLREEMARLMARLERLGVYERPAIMQRYNALVGEENLRLFTLALEVSELEEKVKKAAEILDAGGLPDAAVIEEAAAAVHANYARRIRERREELDIHRRMELPDPAMVERLTSALQRAIAASHPLLSASFSGEEMKEAYSLYRSGDAEALERLAATLAAAAEGAAPPADMQALTARLECLHTDCERLSLTFPFVLSRRLDDERWVSIERARIERETRALARERGELDRRLHALLRDN